MRDGDHVATGDGFVAIRDINPQADTHLLVLPERHVDSFRDVGEFEPDEAKRMLEFVAQTAARGRAGGLPRGRQRRPRRRSDHLPPALARLRRENARDAGMSLIVRIEEDLRAARLARDDARRDALSLILSSLRSAEKELQRPLHDNEELQVLQRERKRRVEAAEAFRAAGRDEQADAGGAPSWRCSRSSCPSRSARTTSRRSSTTSIAEVGATSMRDLGRVMADVMPQVAGRADGSVVTQIVREKLA